MPRIATVGLVGGLRDNGAIGAPEEPASKDGKDAFHRVPFILGEVRDAVERTRVQLVCLDPPLEP